MTNKPTNPKDACGILKPGLSCVPMMAVLRIGTAMNEGARKYGRHNYRDSGVRASVYFDALMRHMIAFWEGEDIDKESGLCHLDKAAACLVVWMDAQANGMLTDDRPPVAENLIPALTAVVKAQAERHPNPKEAHVRRDARTQEHLQDDQEGADRAAPADPGAARCSGIGPDDDHSVRDCIYGSCLRDGCAIARPPAGGSGGTVRGQ